MIPNKFLSWSNTPRTLISGLVVLAAGISSLSAITIVPPGLSPGDTYRLVFVTDGTTTATSADIGYYNAFVAAEAAAVPGLAALGTTWSAVGSTATVHARDNTGTNPSADGQGVQIFKLSGATVATNNADLWDGRIANAINVTPQGNAGRGRAWTGSSQNGRAWSGRTLGASSVRYGSPVDAAMVDAGNWMTWSEFGSGANYKLYGMSGLLTVPGSTTPETGSTAFMLGGVLSGLVLIRRKQSRRTTA